MGWSERPPVPVGGVVSPWSFSNSLLPMTASHSTNVIAHLLICYTKSVFLQRTTLDDIFGHLFQRITLVGRCKSFRGVFLQPRLRGIRLAFKINIYYD